MDMQSIKRPNTVTCTSLAYRYQVTVIWKKTALVIQAKGEPKGTQGRRASPAHSCQINRLFSPLLSKIEVSHDATSCYHHWTVKWVMYMIRMAVSPSFPLLHVKQKTRLHLYPFTLSLEINKSKTHLYFLNLFGSSLNSWLRTSLLPFLL